MTIVACMPVSIDVTIHITHQSESKTEVEEYCPPVLESFPIPEVVKASVVNIPTIGDEIKSVEDFELRMNQYELEHTNKSTPYIFSVFNPKSKSEEATVKFVERFYKTSIDEFNKYGQPPSVKLAQGLIESDRGRSWLVENANAYFGIKCIAKKCKKGHCVNRHDDDPYDRFHKYNTAWESFRHHSIFLQRKNYNKCRKLKDYKSWCRCLKERGYATKKTYAEDLIHTIEKYKLYEFDNLDNSYFKD